MSRTMTAVYDNSSKAIMEQKANLRINERGFSCTLESQSGTKVNPVGLMTVKIYDTTVDPGKTSPLVSLHVNGDTLDSYSFNRVPFLYVSEVEGPTSSIYKSPNAEVAYMELGSGDSKTYAIVWEFNGKIELHSLIATTGDGPIFDPPRSFELITMAGQGKFEATYDISAPA